MPRSLLAHFEDGKGVLWAYEKGKAVRPSTAINECRERDFYEYKLNGRATENLYEGWLGQIETFGNIVHQMVVNRQELIRRDAETWATFVAALFVRTRKARKQISDTIVQRFKKQVDDPAFIRDMQYQLLQKGELIPAEELRKQIDSIRAAMDASPSFYHLSGLPRNTRSLAEALLTKDWHTIETPADKSFLISDCPVMTVAINGRQISPGAGFANANVAALLPMTPQAMFVASPPDVGWKKVADPSGVDNINRLAVQFAHRNVYANSNSPDTQLLVDTQIDAVKFSVNAFLEPAS